MLYVLQNVGSESSRRVTTNWSAVLARVVAVDGVHAGKQETGLLHRYVCQTTGLVHFSFCIFNQFSVGVKKTAVVQLRGALTRI
jgi:hypothetical protein